MNTHVLISFDDQRRARIAVATSPIVDQTTARMTANVLLTRRLEVEGRPDHVAMRHIATIKLNDDEVEYHFVATHSDQTG